MCGIL